MMCETINKWFHLQDKVYTHIEEEGPLNSSWQANLRTMKYFLQVQEIKNFIRTHHI